MKVSSSFFSDKVFKFHMRHNKGVSTTSIISEKKLQ